MSIRDRDQALYNSFFGFKEAPFDNRPDPRFLYPSNKHREALAQMIYGVRERKGFVVLTGVEGTGKTTIVKALIERLDENCKVAYMLDPKLSITGFLRDLCDDFGLHVKGNSKLDYLTKLHDFLLDSHQRDKTTILIIDGAQNLNASLFEEVRMLTNLETSRQKLLQIFLVGRPELDHFLDQIELRQLKQRISIRYRLPPLDCEETKEYVHARMKTAGAKNIDCFTQGAIQEIYKHSQGLPGLINPICDKSLWLGCTRKTRSVDERIVQESAADLKLDRVPLDDEAQKEKGVIRFAGRSFAYTPLILILILWALVVTGVGLFLKNRQYSVADRPVQTASSQGIPIEVASQQPDYGEETMAAEEGDGYPLQTETEQAIGALVPEADQTQDSEAVETSEPPGKALSPTLSEPGEAELPGMTTMREDTVETEVPRELGTPGLQIPEGVQELTSESGDVGKIDVVQVARLPEDEGQTALGQEPEGQKEVEDTPATAGRSFRTEEEILIELGEIKGPQEESEKGEPTETPSIDLSGKSKETREVEPFSAEREEEVVEEARRAPGDELVTILGDLEGQSETGEELPRGEELKEAEEELASLETERAKESVDVKATEAVVEPSREDRGEARLEKQSKGGPSLIVAEEEEVKQFFVQYIQRYNQKDLDGFLSLFSDKAVQNGKDGIDSIRRMYSSFFNQSKKLRYRLEDTRIDVYQNAVEARARYEVDQTLKNGKKKKAWKGEVRWVLVRENGSLKVVSLDYKQR